MMTLDQFLLQAKEKIAIFNTFISTHQLENMIIADHIVYKCASSEYFETIRRLLEAHADYVYQSVISERRIAVIKLTQPVITECGTMRFLELADQKPDGSQQNGFDHLECYPTQNTVEEIVTYFADKEISVNKVVRPHHTTYDTSLADNFKLRLETEPLINKIVREEINSL